MEPSEQALSRLLSGRPGLSRPEKEELLEAILAEVEPAARTESARSWWGVLGALGAAAGAAAVLWVSPVDPDAGFAARGAGQGPQLTVVCAGTTVAGRCNVGGALMFELADAKRFSHAALFAFREDGTALWYAPAHAQGASVAIEHDGGLVLLPTKVELGADHPPGRYTVTAVLSQRPLGRDEIRALYERSLGDARIDPGAVLVQTEVVVQ